MSDSTALNEEILYKNPIVLQRADPWIYKHIDGYYYYTATAPEYDRIELRRASSIEGIGQTSASVIWKKHLTGEMGAHIWAPEIHFIDGKWYIYFAAGATEAIWNIRIFVLENQSANPLEGDWVEKGEVKTKWETFSLDATTFEHKGIRYLVWAQKDPNIEGNTNLYIDSMKNPWTLDGKQIMITKPQYSWETIGYLVNEGPAVIKKNGKIFISYSASATDHNYCMGLLTASEDSDLLNEGSWKKSSVPVFETNIENSQYGPGHNCFTISEDNASDILVYHSRDYMELKGSPLSDPNRHTRAQKLNWNDDGTPNFGVPAKNSI
jgi:GH43 family beta-xylosidase